MVIRRKSIEADANLAEGPRPAKSAVGVRKAPRKIRYEPVTLSETDGVRYLHFGTEWVQGAMRLKKPDHIELEYAQQMMAWMLFIPEPSKIVQLGLGGAALTKFTHKHFLSAQTTAIELNPEVIHVCHHMFRLPPDDDRLEVREQDAFDYVRIAPRGGIDVLQIDLYDALAAGPVLDTTEFYQACRYVLHRDGIATINLFGDHPSFVRNIRALKEAFDTVLCLNRVHDGNVIAVAFARSPALNFADLYARAEIIQTETGLPASQWVHALKAAAVAQQGTKT